jgi:hypothetical protein
MRAPVVAALVLSFAPLTALAQDDLLAPLETNKPKPKPKPRPKPVPHAAPLIKKKSQIAIKVTPSSKEATLVVDGTPEGVVPEHPVDLSPGEHTLTIKRPGYLDYTKRVTVVEGQVVELSAVLELSPGLLTVTAEPEGAEVWVDGRSIGISPLREVPLSAGSHDVAVRSEGYEEDLSHLVVKSGKPYTLSSRLKAIPAPVHVVTAISDRPEVTRLTPTEPPSEVTTGTSASVGEETPVYKRWYVWTGVAAVVAAAVITAVVVTHDKSGTTTPSGYSVCGASLGCTTCLNAPAGTPGCG